MNALEFSLRRSVLSAVTFLLVALLVGAVPTVRAQVCGDGVVDPPEQCDTGGDDSACPSMCADDCTCAVCGDNVVAPGFEDCDGTSDAACPGMCQGLGDPFPCQCRVCGDGVKNGNEECDGTDAAACPGNCSDACTCVVCGDNVANGPNETCDGSDDALCPGLCGAPDSSRPCLCPISPYKCASRKALCVAKAQEYLLKCHFKAEHKGVAVDSACIQAAHIKFDGGTNAAQGCFQKLEAAAEGACFTNDDTTTTESAIDDFVGSVVTAVDPSYPTPVLDPCSAGKKVCVYKLTTAVLKCLSKAEAKHLPLDPRCMQKAEDKFDCAPPFGCLAKLAAHATGCDVGDGSSLQSASEGFAQGLACQLDSTGPGCP